MDLGWESPGSMPVPFVVGVPRSGTTLLRMMLDAHPDLAIPPETHFITRLVRHCSTSTSPAESFVDTLRSLPRWSDFHVEISDVRTQVYSLDPFDLGEALRVFYRLYASRHDKSRWGDKTPPYLGCMQLIHTLLPEVRFVHVIRDGRDVALSVIPLWFGPNTLHEAAAWWTKGIRKARKQSAELPYYLEVRYEDLVSDTETVLSRVCKFIRLPWDPSMLTSHEQAEKRLAELDQAVTFARTGQLIEHDKRQSIHAGVKESPHTARIARWKREMSPVDRHAFEEVAGSTLERLGYEC